MAIREVTTQTAAWNKTARHPLQSWEWGEFRLLTGVKVVRYGVFSERELVEPVTVTIHPIPYTPFSIGYYPKGGVITEEVGEVLATIATDNKCVYIKCEPGVLKGGGQEEKKLRDKGFKQGRSLFTPHNFVLDVSQSEEELLSGMKQKTRYNIRLAEKKGVKVEIDNSETAFERYLELTEETTSRQGFYAHSREYHQKMWKILHKAEMAELMVAEYEGEIVTAWVLFTHNETLYYPYGASTREHRSLMANNLVMWEVIRHAKKKGLKKLDMWGALSSEPKKSDPWYGFHKFKEGYGGEHLSYIGTWDYVARPLLYYPLRIIEELRWKFLRLKK